MVDGDIGEVWFVGAGPGDPELLTCKAARLLASARCCLWAGSLVHPAILDLLPAGCEVHDSASMTLEAILAWIEARARAGIDVIRLHTGEPALYGAIGEQMRGLDARRIPYQVVPGISAWQAAAAALRVELTAPGISQTVILTRAAGRTPVPDGESLQRLGASRASLCLYLSAGMAETVCATLIPHYGADCPAAMVYHASWPDEEIVTGTLADLPGRVAHITRTAVLLVGHALAPGDVRSKLYDAGFTHGYRDGTGAGTDSGSDPDPGAPS